MGVCGTGSVDVEYSRRPGVASLCTPVYPLAFAYRYSRNPYIGYRYIRKTKKKDTVMTTVKTRIG